MAKRRRCIPSDGNKSALSDEIDSNISYQQMSCMNYGRNAISGLAPTVFPLLEKSLPSYERGIAYASTKS